jgi:integrase
VLDPILERRVRECKGTEVFPWWEDGKDRKRVTSDLSKLYSRIFEAAGCCDLHFHDLRHEATSRLFERTNLSGEAIMKITGHRSHAMVMRYLSLRASELAASLW